MRGIYVVERAVTITGKNSLFAGPDAGARRWAIANALIQTGKLNKPLRLSLWGVGARGHARRNNKCYRAVPARMCVDPGLDLGQ